MVAVGHKIGSVIRSRAVELRRICVIRGFQIRNGKESSLSAATHEKRVFLTRKGAHTVRDHSRACTCTRAISPCVRVYSHRYSPEMSTCERLFGNRIVASVDRVCWQPWTIL